MNIWQRLDKLEREVDSLKFELTWARNDVRGYKTPEGEHRPGLSRYFWGLVSALGYTWTEPERTKTCGEFKKNPPQE